MCDRNVPLHLIQQQARHKNIGTTAQYVNSMEQEKVKATMALMGYNPDGSRLERHVSELRSAGLLNEDPVEEEEEEDLEDTAPSVSERPLDRGLFRHLPGLSVTRVTPVTAPAATVEGPEDPVGPMGPGLHDEFHPEVETPPVAEDQEPAPEFELDEGDAVGPALPAPLPYYGRERGLRGGLRPVTIVRRDRVPAVPGVQRRPVRPPGPEENLPRASTRLAAKRVRRNPPQDIV